MPKSFLYLLSIDFFYDISQIKNANFVGNCEILKQMYFRIERYLKDKTKKAYKTIRRGSGNASKTKEGFVDLIFEVASGYTYKTAFGKRKKRIKDIGGGLLLKSFNFLQTFL